MKTSPHTFRWSAALLLVAACTLAFTWQDAKFIPGRQGESIPQPVVIHNILFDVGDGYSCGGAVMLGLTMADSETGEAKRSACMLTSFTWRQVLTQSAHGIRTVSADSSEPIDQIQEDISVSRARGFAARAADPDAHWDDTAGQDGKTYCIVARPADGLTWGQVEVSEQVLVTYEVLPVEPFPGR